MPAVERVMKQTTLSLLNSDLRSKDHKEMDIFLPLYLLVACCVYLDIAFEFFIVPIVDE